MTKRRSFIDHFKVKFALEALHGDETIDEIATRHQMSPNRVSTWKRLGAEGMAAVFVHGGKNLRGRPRRICTRRRLDQKPRLASENGSSSTITSARIPLLADDRPSWFTGKELKQPTPINRCKKWIGLHQTLSKMGSTSYMPISVWP